MPSSERAPLAREELEDLLEEMLDPVLSSRRTAAPLAGSLALLPAGQQQFVLHWAGAVAASSTELAYQVVALAPRALSLLDLASMEGWLVRAMDVYDREGLYAASAVLKDLEGFGGTLRERRNGVSFDAVAGFLGLFLRGLAGRRLDLQTAEFAFTDTATVFLPERVSLFGSPGRNRALYKSMAALLWAQTRFGTFNADLEAGIAGCGDRAATLANLATLEAVRLGMRIAGFLPGLAAEMLALRGESLPGEAAALAAKLEHENTTVEDSLAVLRRLPPGTRLPCWPYAGVLMPERATRVRAARMESEKAALRGRLAGLLQESGGDPLGRSSGRFKVQRNGEERQEMTLLLDGRPVAPPEGVAQLLRSIALDLGAIPPEYLAAAGDGACDGAGAGRDADAQAPAPAADALLYDEWDHRRGHYRKGWCVLQERAVRFGDRGFVEATLARYAPQVRALRRRFEALRGEDKVLQRELFGDDVDLDAVVESHAELRAGLPLAERLFRRRDRVDRNMAVMFMVDMSGSTKGWINDAEREALVMMGEALEILGDRYAIYGFSGVTRKRCEIYPVKRFDEGYSEEVKRRIAGIQPLDFTRMGVAIRHLSVLLAREEARTRLLVTLSDGKPDDHYDGYRGEYGIEDTRQALIEAKRLGIHPFCITIDREARDYLPHMYGAVNWTLVDDVARLPLKVADIYRRLTT
jgi:nitric oxide reductase NorD protein